MVRWFSERRRIPGGGGGQGMIHNKNIDRLAGSVRVKEGWFHEGQKRLAKESRENQEGE